jgi:hypothetical protein
MDIIFYQHFAPNGAKKNEKDLDKNSTDILPKYFVFFSKKFLKYSPTD